MSVGKNLTEFYKTTGCYGIKKNSAKASGFTSGLKMKDFKENIIEKPNQINAIISLIDEEAETFLFKKKEKCRKWL
jgi:hypothetical protein